jgi:serine/threonine-protein kinase
MASVWIARQLGKHGFEKLVAIKTILPRYARNPHFQRMFLDEARIASRIQHVNVAQILDLGDHDGILFIAMEWIDGDSLSKVSRTVQAQGLTIPSGVALRVVADVCAGLHAAHELCDRNGAPLDIVHRDISPHNVLIGDQGVAKIIDFGIAKARDRVGGDTETGSLKGKVRYMAPEQALSPRTADRRADVWAAGAILYYLLSGRAPFASDNDVATLTQLASGKAPESLPPGVSEKVRDVVKRALAWETRERYQTADELRRAIEAAMLETGLTATGADIAVFCAQHLSDRANLRKAAISAALAEAEERSRNSRAAAAAGASGANARPSQPPPSPSDAVPLAPRSGSLNSEAPPGEKSNTTLGASATMTTSPRVSAPKRMRRRLATGLTVAAVVVGVGVAGISIGRRSESTTDGSRGPGPTSAGDLAGEPKPQPSPSVATPKAATPPSSDTPSASSTAAPSAAPAPPPRRRALPPKPPASATTKTRPDYGF